MDRTPLSSVGISLINATPTRSQRTPWPRAARHLLIGAALGWIGAWAIFHGLFLGQ